MYYNLKEAVRVRMADSDYVRLVNDVCSDESWGPTGQQMDEVAKVFHCGYTDIMEEVIRRLEKRHKSWRRCYKALLLVDYLARNLQERYVDELRRLLPLLSHISTTFHYKDEKNVDHGLSIRERSKKVAELLKDPEHLANERRITQETQRRVAGGGATVGYNDRAQSVQSHTIVSSGGGVPGGGHHYGHNNVRSEATSRPSPSYDPYPGSGGTQSTEDADMALARRLQEEEDRRAGRHLQETQLGGQRPHQPQPTRAQQPARAASNTPATTTHTNQEDEDMRLAMELQRQFDDADGTDNTTVAITRAHTTPQKSPQVSSQPQPQAIPQPITQKKPPTDALDDIFGQPSAPSNAATQSRNDDDFDFFSGAPTGRPQQPSVASKATPKQSDPFGDDFFNAPQTSAPPQSSNTWGHSAEVHNPPPRPTTKDPFADLVRVAMAQGTGVAEENTTHQPTSSQTPAYNADKRKGDLDDLFN